MQCFTDKMSVLTGDQSFRSQGVCILCCNTQGNRLYWAFRQVLCVF